MRASDQLMMRAQTTAGVNMVEAVKFKWEVCMWYCLYHTQTSGELVLCVEQSDCEHRMNFNIIEVEVFVEEVNAHSVKERKKNKWI